VGASAKGGRFASRAGEKLDAALEAFGLDVSGLTCADFGCNVGGFTDCLLRRGARKVFAVDTGYGTLAWSLRQDLRVTVMERTNALRCPVPELVDLVAVDVAWTPQTLIIPAAARWRAPGGRIVSLLKPHYEIAKAGRRKPHAPLDDDQARQACLDSCRRLAEAGLGARAVICSPLRGKGGNLEFLLMI
jgi:23S rRNA (cytidine1920-2'-O)/16S rRNA (cytidine1409-2'-O)-methyltransferase